jgi:hypothetical protein
VSHQFRQQFEVFCQYYDHYSHVERENSGRAIIFRRFMSTTRPFQIKRKAFSKKQMDAVNIEYRFMNCCKMQNEIVRGSCLALILQRNALKRKNRMICPFNFWEPRKHERFSHKSENRLFLASIPVPCLRFLGNSFPISKHFAKTRCDDGPPSILRSRIRSSQCFGLGSYIWDFLIQRTSIISKCNVRYQLHQRKQN